MGDSRPHRTDRPRRAAARSPIESTHDHVLEQLTSTQRHEGFSLIILSHDMGVIAETCDRVAVMYAGHVVELGTVRDVFNRPAHPYTLGLINAIPRIGDKGKAVSIPGHPPADLGLEPGCRFALRCPFREDACRQPVGWRQLTDGHGERCLFPDRRERLSVAARLPATWEAVAERLQT